MIKKSFENPLASRFKHVYIPANFPDSDGIFPISTILPDFPIGIFKILNFPDFPFYDNLTRILPI
jgi:hypothetical protein